MKIWIKTSEKKFPLIVESSDDLCDLKQTITDHTSVDVSAFELSLNNVSTLSGSTLKDAGIVSGDTIYLMNKVGNSLVASCSMDKPEETSSSCQAKKREPKNVCEFPNEVLVSIFKRLKVRDVLHLSSVCRRFNIITDDEDLWEHLLIRDFGTEARDTAGMSFKQQYVIEYLRKQREDNRSRSAFAHTIPSPPPDFPPVIPGTHKPEPPVYPQFPPGIIGGPDDLFPIPGGLARPQIPPWFNPNQPRHPHWPEPFGDPRGPRIYPVRPFPMPPDPFSRPRQPGSSRYPDPNNPGFPGGNYYM